MSIEVERPTLSCGICAGKVHELRRGRCWGCYSRWADNRPVGMGAACVVCNERRREQLRMAELHGRFVPTCHSCHARVLKMVPLPSTVDEIRGVLHRERRVSDRRSAAGMDRRFFQRERRVGQRRLPPRAAGQGPYPVFFASEIDDLEIEIDQTDMEIVEPTLVLDRST